YPPATNRPAADAAASRTTSFCSCAPGSQGATHPPDTKAKKLSPVTSADLGNRAVSSRATVDLPAPGGPLTTISSACSVVGGVPSGARLVPLGHGGDAVGVPARVVPADVVVGVRVE